STYFIHFFYRWPLIHDEKAVGPVGYAEAVRETGRVSSRSTVISLPIAALALQFHIEPLEDIHAFTQFVMPSEGPVDDGRRAIAGFFGQRLVVLLDVERQFIDRRTLPQEAILGLFHMRHCFSYRAATHELFDMPLEDEQFLPIEPE